MSAHHFFVTPDGVEPDVVRLVGDEAHHAARVLRMAPGEEITVADGTGRIVRAVVTTVGDTVLADIKDESRAVAPRPVITLYQALTKGDKIDDVIEKATEVGVRRIVPFVAERTIVKWDERKLGRAHDRWASIARAAAKQSRAAWIPAVDVVSPDPIRVLAEPGAKIVLHEGSQRRLRDALPSDAPEHLALVVGPEGGLSETEVDELRSGGADVASLGPQILRTETAGPVVAGIIAYSYGTFG